MTTETGISWSSATPGSTVDTSSRALFKGPDDFNGCGYFHVSLLLIALRHICRWCEENLGSEFVANKEFVFPGVAASADYTLLCLTRRIHVARSVRQVFSFAEVEDDGVPWMSRFWCSCVRCRM